MDQRFATAVTQKPQLGPTLTRRLSVTCEGWPRSSPALCSFLLFGYFVIYWRNADMDFMVIYNALRSMTVSCSDYFDHPAYITILALSSCSRLLMRSACPDAWSLSPMPPVADAAASEAALTHAARRTGASLLIATGCAGLAGSMRLIVDWRIAPLATEALRFGSAVHSRTCPTGRALNGILHRDPDRGWQARPCRAAARACAGSGVVPARTSEQGSGGAPDRRVAASDPAVRKRRQHKRAFLAPCAYRLACGGGRVRRHDRRGVARLAVDRNRLRPRAARRRRIPSA
jgi:hypothetical protein